jgi:serine/threonine protein kinase
VVAQSVEGEEQEYLIFKNVKLGEGGFGVVKKALNAKEKTRELAVKIVPYGGDPVKRKKIEREINIIRVLPPHPNLVRVIPVKCFSENNFYIFMEMCREGTLADWLAQPGLLEEAKIFDAFWQLMSGYRILW